MSETRTTPKHLPVANSAFKGWLLLTLAWLLGASATAAEFTDLFADRQTVTEESGQVTGSNVGATLEVKEPRHGGKPGGHSVWLSWVAPQKGIVTFQTDGSGFDTLLGVYVLEAGDKPPMERLKPVAQNDDNGALPTSLVQFGVEAGVRYEIAVDGFNGLTGAIILHWDLLRSDKPLPVIVHTPDDRALRQGDTLTLTVAYQAANSVKLAWFFNGSELPNEESETLTIVSFAPANVGRYQLRFTANGIRFFSDPVEVQINSEGQTNALARNKLFDSVDSGLKPRDDDGQSPGGTVIPARGRPRPAAPPVGVTRGYDGTQIFNTSYAGRDPAEPQHCGVAGGTSYWFAYDPPTNGVVSLDTAGSSFDTVLAVYTFDPPLLGYQSLIPVNCDDNAGPDTVTSRLQFTAALGRTYLIVVDGVNGARGLAYLNYHLADNSAAGSLPPGFRVAPQPLLAAENTPVSFRASATGSPPLGFQWWKDDAPLADQTTDTLLLPAVRPEHAGSYRVVITNAFGSTNSPPVTLAVFGPAAIRPDAPAGALIISFPVAGALRYAAEQADQLGTNAWTAWFSGVTNGPATVVLTNQMSEAAHRFFRVRFDLP